MSSHEVFNRLSLAEEFVSGLLDASLRDLIVKVKAEDGSVLAVLGGAGEGEHKTCGNSVELAVALESDGLPLITAVDPVSHVVDGSVTCGGS